MRLFTCLIALFVLVADTQARGLFRGRAQRNCQPCQSCQPTVVQGQWGRSDCPGGVCPAPTVSAPAVIDAIKPAAVTVEGDPHGLLAAVNAERTRRGLNALTLSAELTRAAQNSANVQISRGLGHWVPLAGTGEICAQGHYDANDAVRGWLGSRGHAQMMLGNHTKMGGGRAGPYWAVQFGN